MELLLIILGSILVAAIIFMIIDGLRGEAPELTEDPLDFGNYDESSKTRK